MQPCSAPTSWRQIALCTDVSLGENTVWAENQEILSPLALLPSPPFPPCQFPHQIIPDNEVRMIHWFSDEHEFIIKIYIFQSPDMCSQIPNLINM